MELAPHDAAPPNQLRLFTDGSMYQGGIQAGAWTFVVVAQHQYHFSPQGMLRGTLDDGNLGLTPEGATSTILEALGLIWALWRSIATPRCALSLLPLIRSSP